MMAKVQDCALVGLDGVLVEVEVDITDGWPEFTIVGLTDTTLNETKERVRAAIKNSEYLFPDKHIVINLAPADLLQEGSACEFSMAVGILLASGQIKPSAQTGDSLFLGELSREGSVGHRNGILPMVVLAIEKRIRTVFVSVTDTVEASLVEGVTAYPVATLGQLVAHLNDERRLEPYKRDPHLFEEVNEVVDPHDVSSVRGQEHVKRVLEVAASGGHHVLMTGPPGSGKALLARTIPSILPRMDMREALDTAKIYSVGGMLPPHMQQILQRPFRALPHTISHGGLSDVAGFAFVTRGKDYRVLDHPLVQARLHLPPDQVQQRPESQTVRSLYDCPEIPVGPDAVPCRVIVATHPAGKKKSPVGVTRAGVVYELFFTNLPQPAFTACDVVELYLHRGAFEPALSDEDQEIDPDRWCSHSAWGQEAWQIISQWVWNLRLELGHHLHPDPVRTTEFAPALPPPSPHTALPPAMRPMRWAPHGRPVAFRAAISRSNQTGRFGVQPTRGCGSRSSAEKPMAACVSCMGPASAVAGPVRCVSSVNGRGRPRRSRVRSASCSIRSLSVPHRSSGEIGAAESTGVPACTCFGTNGLKSAAHQPRHLRMLCETLSFPANNALTRVSRGTSDSRVTLAPKHLVSSCSSSSEFRNVLPPGLA